MARGFSMMRHGIPLLALGCMGFAGWTVVSNYAARAIIPPPIAAPADPYRIGVSGSGIVEPSSEVIALAIERGGVVVKVHVMAGIKVQAGAPLFAIDDRNYRARVSETEAAVAAAAAEITSIDQSIIQQQDVIAQAQASLASAAAEVIRANLDHDRYTGLSKIGGAPVQRLETADADMRKAAAARTAAEAALAGAKRQNEVLAARRVEAGARLAQAKAVQEQAQVDLDKTIVRSPIDGTILKVNVRLGEYASPGMLPAPLMTMGATDVLHVRVDIDETDAWRVRPEGSATARLRGNPGIATTLRFVRFEPYVLPKRSLTGSTIERVDTRVLQAIYAFAPAAFPALVGQQVDVFIEATDRADVVPPKTAPGIR